jgi:hypothetical protein
MDDLFVMLFPLSSFGNLFRQTVSLGLDGPVGCGP